MEKIILECEKREVGKEAVKRLKKQGYLPAILYGKGIESLPLMVRKDGLKDIIHHSGLINLKVKGEKKVYSIILKEVQKDYLEDRVLHLDFHQITAGQMVTTTVPIEISGEAVGIKEGGTVDHVLWEVEIETLPVNIPEKIGVDISELHIGDSLYVSDIKTPPEIKILSHPEDVVVSLLAPRKAEEAPVVEEEEAQPEVISEKEAEERRKKEGEKPEEEKEEKKESEKK